MSLSVHKQIFTLNGQTIPLLVPSQSEQNVDELWQKHGQSEDYFPYWLHAWKASFALYSYLQYNPTKSESLLELGCGNGCLAQMLQAQSGTKVHCDLSPEALQFCAGLWDQSLWVRCDLRQSCFHSAFDLILAAELGYEDHLLEAVLQSCSQNLKVGGRAILAETIKIGREHNPELVRNKWIGSVEIVPWDYQLDEQKLVSRIYILEL